MADPLSVTASLIAVVQLSGSIISFCYDYRRSLKNAQKDAVRLLGEAQSLRNTIERMLHLLDDDQQNSKDADSKCHSDEETLNGTDFGSTTLSPSLKESILLPSLQSLLQNEDGTIAQCCAALLSVEERLRKPLREWQQEKGKRIVGVVLKLAWPLRERDVTDALTSIHRLRSVVELALAADNTTVVVDIRKTQLSHEAKEREAKEAKRLRREKQSVLQWLHAPPGIAEKHLDVCSRRAQDTAGWLLDSESFQSWLGAKNEDHENGSQTTSLWLHGIPGCGKTVLASTVIQHLRHDPLYTVAYYYFDFGNEKLSQTEMMLRALTTQLLCGEVTLPTPVKNAIGSRFPGMIGFDGRLVELSYRGRQLPSTNDLVSIFREAVGHALHNGRGVCIVLDALDECSDQETLQNCLRNILSWKFPEASGQLKIFQTSRHTSEIADALETSDYVVAAKADEVDKDIQTFVSEQLAVHPRLRRWPANLRKEIQHVLTNGARGMFRWVDCQLSLLQKCITVRDVRRALSSLPRSLSETYLNTVKHVDEFHRVYAIRILLWLAVSAVPLDIRESADALAVELDDLDGQDGEEDSFFFDEEMRVPDVMDIPTMCTTLVRTITRPDEDDPDKSITELHLAHYTVKEFLLSPAFLAEFLGNEPDLPPSIRDITTTAAVHDYATKIMLRYLLSLQQPLTEELVQDRPLARVAAMHWSSHFKKSPKDSKATTALAMKLLGFGSQKLAECYRNCWRLTDLTKPWRPPDLALDVFPEPVFYASLTGLSGLVALLLEAGANPHIGSRMHKTCLQAAATHGQTDVVRVLLEAKADPNLGGGISATPLIAACKEGHADIVQLLLAFKANPDLKVFGPDGNALMVACRKNDAEIVRLLVEAGARIDTYNRKIMYANPLGVAAFKEQHECLDILIPAAEPKLIETTLSVIMSKTRDIRGVGKVTAAKKMHDILLYFQTYVPDIVARFDENFSAAAAPHAEQDHALAAAVVTETRCPYTPDQVQASTSIMEAFRNGQTDIAREILAIGTVDPSSPLATADQGGTRYLLCEAVKLGNVELVRLCLEHGADSNAADTDVGCPISYAARFGQLEIVQLLVEKGKASVSNANSTFGSPLQAATFGNYIDVLQYLVSAGADVNEIRSDAEIRLSPGLERQQYTSYSPLAIAVLYDIAETVDFLLSNGALPDDPSQYKLFRWIRPQGDNYPSVPLILALVRRTRRTVDRLLPEWIASIKRKNQQPHPDVLYFAIQGGSVPIIRQVLEQGIDANAKVETSSMCASMLSIVCMGCALPSSTMAHLEYFLKGVLTVLLEAGADPNQYSQIDSHFEPPLQTLMRSLGPRGGFDVADLAGKLIEYGADVRATSDEGWTVLHQAARHGLSHAVLKLIEEFGADPNDQLVNGSSAIHAAANLDEEDCVAVLVNCGHVDINVQNKSGRTPLHWAAENGSLKTVKWLLAHGADDKIEEHATGMTAADYAVMRLQQAQEAARDNKGLADVEFESNKSMIEWREDGNNTVEARAAVLSEFRKHESEKAKGG